MCQIVIGRVSDIRPEVMKMYVNKDGYGLAFMEQNRVRIYKSMEREAIQQIMHRLPGSQAVIVHSRLATSGVVGTFMSHPYFIASDPIQVLRWQVVLIDDLHLAATCVLQPNERVVFHNGVVGGGTKILSDTAVAAIRLQELTIEEVFSPYDRVVVLDGQGHITLNNNVLLHLKHFEINRQVVPNNWWVKDNVLLSNPPHGVRRERPDESSCRLFLWENY